MSNFVCIIPARGGSKGIVRKNLQQIGGVPLIVRTVIEAKKSGLGQVIATTDDRDIGESAELAGASYHHRSPESSSDSASSESALLEVLLDGQFDLGNPEYIVFLQCIAPFMQADDIVELAERVTDEGADCGFVSTLFHRFIWQESHHHLLGVNHEKNSRLRRQSVSPQYLEAGSAYIMRTATFLERKHRFFGRIVTYTIPEIRALEIDTYDDLRTARMLSSVLDNSPQKSVIYVDVDNTLCVTHGMNYAHALPIPEAIAEVNRLAQYNFIVCWTSRGRGTGTDYSEMTCKQLNDWGVKYDSFTTNKPVFDWIYDDRAIPVL